MKEFCRDPPDRAARAPHAVHPTAPGAPALAAGERYARTPLQEGSVSRYRDSNGVLVHGSRIDQSCRKHAGGMAIVPEPSCVGR